MTFIKKIQRLWLGEKIFKQKYCSHDYVFDKRTKFTHYSSILPGYSYVITTYEGDLYMCSLCEHKTHKNTKIIKDSYNRSVEGRQTGKNYTLTETTDHITGTKTKTFS